MADIGSLSVQMTADASSLQSELAKATATLNHFTQTFHQNTVQAIKNASATVTGFAGSMFSDPLGALAGLAQRIPVFGNLLALPFEGARYALSAFDSALGKVKVGDVFSSAEMADLRDRLPQAISHGTTKAMEDVARARTRMSTELSMIWTGLSTGFQDAFLPIMAGLVGDGGGVLRFIKGLFDDAGGTADSFVTKVGKGMQFVGEGIAKAFSILPFYGGIFGELGNFITHVSGQVQRFGSQGEFSLKPLSSMLVDTAEYVAGRLAVGFDNVLGLLRGWVPAIQFAWDQLQAIASVVVPLLQQGFDYVTEAAVGLVGGLAGVETGGLSLYETLALIPALLMQATATALDFGANLLDVARPAIAAFESFAASLATTWGVVYGEGVRIFEQAMMIAAVYIDMSNKVVAAFREVMGASGGLLSAASGALGGGLLGTVGGLLGRRGAGEEAEESGERQLSLADRLRAASDAARRAASASRDEGWLGSAFQTGGAQERVQSFFADVRKRLDAFKKDAAGAAGEEFRDFTKEAERLRAQIESPIEKFTKMRDLIDEMANSTDEFGDDWLDADEAALGMLKQVEALEKAVGGGAAKGVAALQEGSKEAYSAIARFQREGAEVDVQERIRQLMERAEQQRQAQLEHARRIAEAVEALAEGEEEED